MNRKELKELTKLAQKIAEFEFIIQTNQDKDEIKNAQNEIMKASIKVNEIQESHENEDVYAIVDELTQEILKKMI